MCAAGSWALPPSLAVASTPLPKFQESISLQTTKEKTSQFQGSLYQKQSPCCHEPVSTLRFPVRNNQPHQAVSQEPTTRQMAARQARDGNGHLHGSEPSIFRAGVGTQQPC